jgi:hypothetical protein
MFNTDKLIIVCFPAGAGGKFLINCLGLSDDAVFQCNKLTRLQLDGRFSQTDKFNLLVQRIYETTDKWTDLRLGCSQLFGFSNFEYLKEPVNINNPDQFDECIPKLIDLNTHYFFIVGHHIQFLQSYLKVWKNAKVIIFENSFEFLQHRGRHLYATSDEHIADLNKFKNSYTGNIIYWDNSWYNSVEKTIAEIENLYNLLNLSDFNSELLTLFYHAWISKVTELKNNSIMNK